MLGLRGQRLRVERRRRLAARGKRGEHRARGGVGGVVDAAGRGGERVAAQIVRGEKRGDVGGPRFASEARVPSAGAPAGPR